MVTSWFHLKCFRNIFYNIIAYYLLQNQSYWSPPFKIPILSLIYFMNCSHKPKLHDRL